MRFSLDLEHLSNSSGIRFCGRAWLQPCRKASNPPPHPSGRQPARTAFDLRAAFPPLYAITRSALNVQGQEVVLVQA